MVRVLPTDEQLAHRKPIVLTQRDRELLFAVYEQGFLTTRLIELAFFPPPSGQRRSHCSAAYERLQQLWLWNLLDRVQLPIAKVLGGSRPLLHTLGAAGVPIVAEHTGAGTTPVQRRRLERLDDAFVTHDLKATELWANLKAHLPATRVSSWQWLPERVLRSRHERVRDPVSRRWLPFLADAAVEFTYPSGAKQLAFIEVDQGTQPLKKFRLKVRSYEAYLASDVFWRRWNRESFEVCVLTHSRNRLANLWRVSRDEVPEERWAWYSFGTYDALDPAKFPDYPWLTLDNEQVALLLTEAYSDQPERADDDLPAATGGWLPASPAASPLAATPPATPPARSTVGPQFEGGGNELRDTGGPAPTRNLSADDAA